MATDLGLEDELNLDDDDLDLGDDTLLANAGDFDLAEDDFDIDQLDDLQGIEEENNIKDDNHNQKQLNPKNDPKSEPSNVSQKEKVTDSGKNKKDQNEEQKKPYLGIVCFIHSILSSLYSKTII